MHTNSARIISNTILIHAPAEKVWQALTNPEETKKYMFGCETVSDWNIGSELLWEGEMEGRKMVFVKGHIADIQPNRHLSYTVFDPNNPSLPDVPENYLTVTYDLEEGDDGTKLTVTQGDFNLVADGDRRYRESYNNAEGWNPMLRQIKSIVESA